MLDFVGQANRKYSFEDRFKALLSRTRKTVEQEAKTGFVNVPRGCSIQLEKQAQEYILENIRSSINNRRNLISKLRDLIEIKHELKVMEFFECYHVCPQVVYSKKITVAGLAAQAELINNYTVEAEKEKLMSAAFARLSSANSRRWLNFLRMTLPQIIELKGIPMTQLSQVERSMLTMFHYTIWDKGIDDLDGRFETIEQAIYWAISEPYIYYELMDLLNYQYEKIDIVDKPINELSSRCPLDLYCTYTLDQILVALGKHTEEKKSPFREGVLYLSEKKLDVFFVTLYKSEKEYSPSTMYKDYSINEELFHWQSQSRTTIESPTGQRYIQQQENGNNVLFFVREYKKDSNMASPFTCIGLADYESHYGSAPISIVWKMKEPLPGFMLQKTVKM